MDASARVLPRIWRPGIGYSLLALLLGVVLLVPAAAQALEPQHWTLQDQDGRPWSLTLVEQADPAYPAGLRLRLTDRSATKQVDHGRPLQLRDGMGRTWELENRSAELVPAGNDVLPAGSAQFDLAGLNPRPGAEAPLVLEVPLDSDGAARLVAGASAVAGLHGAGAAAAPES